MKTLVGLLHSWVSDVGAAVVVPSSGGTSAVTTYHNDNYRSGANANEDSS